jgi:hypothetical protein
MSRVPIHLEPWPTDTTALLFVVFSEEWNADPACPAEMGKVVVSTDNLSCKFCPSQLWREAGYFPQSEQTFELAELLNLCSNPDLYAPRSIHSHRTLQALRTILASRHQVEGT